MLEATLSVLSGMLCNIFQSIMHEPTSNLLEHTPAKCKIRLAPDCLQINASNTCSCLAGANAALGCSTMWWHVFRAHIIASAHQQQP